jgi:hypothetical protein
VVGLTVGHLEIEGPASKGVSLNAVSDLVFYRAYGLSLAANQAIPGLLPESADTKDAKLIDLQIWFECIPTWLESYLASPQTIRYVSPYLDENGQPALIVWLLGDGAFYHLQYAEDVDFILNRDGTLLWIRWSQAVDEIDVFSYLLGPVMGFILRVRGVVSLHASAVAVNQRAAVFIGDAGVGKSTTAMAMGRLGYPIVSDDIVPIYENAGVTYAQPGYPRVRLRQSSLPWLSVVNPDLPPLPEVKGQSRLHFELIQSGYQFQSDPLPIGALYLLAERDADSRAPRVESVSLSDGMMGIVANTYATRFLDTSMRAREFQELSRLVNQVTVRKLYPHQELSHLGSLCDVILGDFSGQV